MQITEPLKEDSQATSNVEPFNRSNPSENDYEMLEVFQKYPSFTLEDKPYLLLFTRLAVKAECASRAIIPMRGVKREALRLKRANDSILKATLFKPQKKQTGKLPILLLCHGGSFVIGSLSAHVRLCERIVKETNCAVIMPDYRLAPSNRFPLGFEDCYQTLDWILKQGESHGIDPKRIAVMGDSAGGAMAASLAQKALDNDIKLRGQLLIYPALDAECRTESARTFVETPLFNAETVKNMWDLYLQCEKRAWPPYASPAHREKLDDLPPTYIETAEFDPLRDEGIAYAKALKESGVKTDLRETKGTIHGYDMAEPKLNITRASINARLAFIKKIFQD
ncbi:MAG: alpha/beta hydrolase [Pseudomonadales bacterium]|nr:alpha/beta hydrolase [Pseudomonadales bacterium]